MLKVTSTYKGTMYRYRHIIDYVEINKFYDIIDDLEKLADYTVELLYSEFSKKIQRDSKWGGIGYGRFRNWYR